MKSQTTTKNKRTLFSKTIMYQCQIYQLYSLQSAKNEKRLLEKKTEHHRKSWKVTEGNRT